MKVFKRVSMLICVVCVVTLFSMTVLATNFPDFYYSVILNVNKHTEYANTTAQSPYNVTVSTKPDSISGVAEVKILTVNDFTNDSSRVAYQAFPGGFDVPPINFVLPAGKTYYAFVFTYQNFTVSGTLHAKY